MQIALPIEITDDNLYSSTISEPDTARGEVAWVSGRASYYDLSASSDVPYSVAAIDDCVYILNGTSDEVDKYDKRGNLVVSGLFPVSSAELGMTASGGYLYTLFSTATSGSQTNEASVSKRSVDGTFISSIDITFSQLATSANRALCIFNGLLYVYSVGTAHKTISVFNLTDGGDVLFEFDVTADFTDTFIYSLTVFDGYIYAMGDSGAAFKCDQSFSTIETAATKALIGGRYPLSLFYDAADDVFWTSALASTTRIYGFLSNAFADMTGVYRTGEQAIKTSTHRIYQAASDTTDDPEAGVLLTPPTWVEVGTTNKYRAFDYQRSDTAVGSADQSNIVYVIKPLLSLSVVALFNLVNVKAVVLTVFEPGNTTAIYNERVSLADVSPIVNMWEYFNYDPLYDEYVIFDDLTIPKFSTVYITLQGVGSDNPAEVGEVVIGDADTIGELVAGSSTDRKSYSTITIDDFGNETITRRPSATYTSFQVGVDATKLRYVERVLKKALDTPALFVGDDLHGEKLVDFGYYERSALVRSNPSISELNLKVRGLV